MSKDEMIRISLQEADPNKNGSVQVEINNHATVQNLVSAYCAKKGIGYNPKLAILDEMKNGLPQYSTLHSLGIGNGQTLYIGYRKQSSSMDRKWIFLLTVMIIAIFVLSIIVMSSLYATSGGVIPFDYGIVMDAGSTKTNVLLYKWAGNKQKGTGCVRQESECKADGGVAVTSDVSYMIPCLNKVKTRINPSYLPSTPLYFAATAGMRLLNISNQGKAEQILVELRELLNNTGLSVKTVEIISGQDEGQYDWIAANFLKNTLETSQQLDPWHPTTVGALDMGGASAQIAFALKPSNTNDTSVEKTELYGQTFDVFSTSSLCFGREEALNRYRALLVKDPTKISNVIDPCAPKGYSYDVTGGELFDGPCTHSTDFVNWLTNYPYLKGANVTFTGSGDFHNCSKGMTSLLDTEKCQAKKFKECFTKPTNLPDKEQKFLAFATYFYTTAFLNLTKSSLNDYIEGTKDRCSKSKSEINMTEKYAPDYCFNACYIYEILVNGYNFTNETWKNIEFLGKIEDKDIGWSLGYMIKATNIIPAKKPSPKFTSVGAFAACMVIFTFIVIVAAVFLAYNFGRKSSEQYSLQNA